MTLATAEFEAAPKMMEAAKMYESSPEGLRLRWMNILYELGQQSQTNTIMLVPAVMPEAGWPPVGTYGFKELPKDQKSSEPKKTATKNQEYTLRRFSKSCVVAAGKNVQVREVVMANEMKRACLFLLPIFW